MDAAYLSAVAALTGSTIGGLTSLAASWLSQKAQFTTQQRTHDIAKREEVFSSFMDEASKLYMDGFEHDRVEISKLVTLFALVSRMRVLCSPRVVTAADSVTRLIIETYLGPNRTFRDIREILDSATVMEPLQQFSEACRDELRRFGA